MSSSIASTCDVSSLTSFVKITNVSCVRDAPIARRRGQSPVLLLVPLIPLSCGNTAQVCRCGGCEWWRGDETTCELTCDQTLDPPTDERPTSFALPPPFRAHSFTCRESTGAPPAAPVRARHQRSPAQQHATCDAATPRAMLRRRTSKPRAPNVRGSKSSDCSVAIACVMRRVPELAHRTANAGWARP
jgi:hypothetical protein